MGATDTDDYYRLIVGENVVFNASLSPSSANADLYLLDANGNTLRSSTLGGTLKEEILNTNLTAGTYYLRVDGLTSNTSYKLNVYTA